MRPLVVLLLCVLATPAAADEPARDHRAATLFDEGRAYVVQAEVEPVADLKRGLYALACGKFDEAIALDPSAAGTMLNLGLCNEGLGKYKTALYWFRRAQVRATESRPALPDYAQAAVTHTSDLADRVAIVALSFTTAPPPNVTVRIDGEPIKPDEYDHVELDPGRHTLDARAPGYKNTQQGFDIVAQHNSIAIELVRGDNIEVVDRGAGRRRAALTFAVAGGALVLASGGYAWYERARYCDHYMSGGCGDNAQLLRPVIPSADAANRAKHRARVYGTALFGAGIAAVGVAAYLYLTAPSKERIDRTALAPTVTPDLVGLAVSGGF